MGVNIRFLGGTTSIGCTSFLVERGNERILVDYGVNPSKTFEMPQRIDGGEINAIVLSHAHLDHSGAIPYLYRGVKKPLLVTTPPTLEFADLLIRDMFRVVRGEIPFTFYELERMIESALPLKYGVDIRLGEDILVRLYDAGHIPGSASILLQINGLKIWYSGDINLVETQLLRPAELPEEADIIILESTYAYKDHPDRREEEKRLVKRVKEVVEERGIVLIPAFSVGRSQEILSILVKMGYDGRIALDGMAQIATEIMLRYGEYLKNISLLEEAISRTKWIRSFGDRRKILKKPGVIIAPAGMLGGGWADWYLKQIYSSEKNALFFVSFQAPGTLGEKILSSKKFIINGREFEIKAQVESFELSSHSDRRDLYKIVRNFTDVKKIFLIHGERGKIEDFADSLKNEGYEVELPTDGASYKIT